jgi:hypothetical protein
VGFKPTIPEFERAKTVHALDRAAVVIAFISHIFEYLFNKCRLNTKWPFAVKRRRLAKDDEVTVSYDGRFYVDVHIFEVISHRKLEFESLM